MHMTAKLKLLTSPLPLSIIPTHPPPPVILLSPLLDSSATVSPPISLPSANIFNCRYRYTGDLLTLSAAVNPQPVMQWPRYHTPVQLELLQPYLIAHPDQEYATYIAAGLRDGFRIGFSHGNARLKARKGNHPSCRAKPEVVTERIAAELSAGRLLGPIAPAHLPLVHTSPMGLVPKPHQPNKFRLIVDLSAPIDNSVNDGIPSDFCSLRYASVDDAVAMVRVLGRGTMLAKIDIKDAYRLIPVHPDDYHLLGITWRGQTYVDRALPFGLCSAPKIFSAVADFISWVLHRHNIPHQLHYLDDFLFLGTPHSEEAGNVLEVVTKVLRMLGIPIAVHKTEGPNTVLTFLGIIIDTVNFELRLPDDKLVRLQALLQSWAGP